MDDLEKHMKFKSLDHFIFTKLAYKINKVTEHSKRKVYQCPIDPQSQSNFTAFYRNVCELNRLFNHFQKFHPESLGKQLISFFKNNNIYDFDNMSCSPAVSRYISIYIKPQIDSQIGIINSQISDPQLSDTTFLNFDLIDLTKLNQVILEHGIFEKQSLRVI